MAKTNTTTEVAPAPPVIHAVQHIELATPEPEKLAKFLGKQFGWAFDAIPMPNGTYHMFRTPDGTGGGVTAPMPGQSVASTPYINVSDLGATLKACEKAGAQILVPVTEVPGQGRFFWFRYAGSPALACWEQAAQK